MKNYKYNLEMFAERMTKSAAKITTDDIRGYIGYLAENRHLAETSLQTHINTLRAFFGWLHIEEKIKKNPMSKIKSLKLDKKGARQARPSKNWNVCAMPARATAKRHWLNFSYRVAAD